MKPTPMPQDQPTLPELPIAAYRRLSDLQDGIDSYYTADQMRSYALAAIAASSPKGAALPEGWQPIETAPKEEVYRDGAHAYSHYILAWWPGAMAPVRARWWLSDLGGGSNFIADGGYAVFPTHWLPLPQPPQESA